MYAFWLAGLDKFYLAWIFCGGSYGGGCWRDIYAGLWVSVSQIRWFIFSFRFTYLAGYLRRGFELFISTIRLISFFELYFLRVWSSFIEKLRLIPRIAIKTLCALKWLFLSSAAVIHIWIATLVDRTLLDIILIHDNVIALHDTPCANRHATVQIFIQKPPKTRE